MKNMSMFVASVTVKRNEFVVQSLDPILILITKEDGLWNGLQNIHVNVDVGIGSVFTLLSSFDGFEKGALSIANSFKDSFIPVFMHKIIQTNLDWGISEILLI